MSMTVIFSRGLQASDMTPDRKLAIKVSFDAAWQKRGTGRAYNSLTGHATIVGYRSGRVLGYAVRSKRCVTCEKNPDKSHDCRKNFTGSAKSMEADMAVELVCKNALLEEANVRVGVFIADDDASSISAVQRESMHRIEKWSDVNHASKSFTNSLYHLHLPKKVIEYLSHCFACAVKKNKGDASAVESALLNVVSHAYGEHASCGDWCRADATNEEYVYKGLPNGKPLSDPELHVDLAAILARFAKNAPKLAPCGSTQGNEAFNNVATTKHPKNRHYGGTESFCYRIAAAVCQVNVGSTYVSDVNNRLELSPGKFTQKYRELRDRRKKKKTAESKKPEIKRRRLFAKRNRSNQNATTQRREGITYQSDCGLINVSGLISDLKIPDESVDYSDAKFVIFDLETNSLGKSAEICQIAALHDGQMFNAYIVPSKGMSASASAVTGLQVAGGEMFLDEVRLDTIPIKTALMQFLDYLRNLGCMTILIAHNGFRFDARIILRNMHKFGLLDEFRSFVLGFADTLEIFRATLPDRKKAKKKFSQAALIEDFLGPNDSSGAHNAIHDVNALKRLIDAMGVTSDVIKSMTKSTIELLRQESEDETCAKNKVSLEELKDSTSASMKTKIAKSGITMQMLVKAYSGAAEGGVMMLLGEDVGGRPRVTKNSKVIKKIVERLEAMKTVK